MKIRTQFVILIAGIIIAPFLVASFMFLSQYVNEHRNDPGPNFQAIDSWIGTEMPGVLRDLKGARPRVRPAGFDIAVIGQDSTILFSTIGDLVQGAKASQAEILRHIRANVSRYHFQIDMPGPENPQGPYFLLRTRRQPREEAAFRNRFMETVMYTALVLLVISALGSVFIVRSLTRSLLRLEQATRRVAGGDLDFEITARGKNEIATLTRSFDGMRRALKEEYARRARFIMGVSHDLKTPLTLIQGYVEAVQDGYATDPEVQKKYLGIVRDKTRSLEGMVNDLIGFVKMETGEWRMTHRDVAALDFFRELAKRYQEDAFILKRSFDSRIDIPPETRVAMDEGLFSRALENLIGNAIRYTEPGGRIVLAAGVATDGETRFVRVEVSDTGIGIPEADIKNIFDPFYRGTNSRREHGFGLGLTTVKSIIESHGWTIRVSSEVGKGTIFTIDIPLAG